MISFSRVGFRVPLANNETINIMEYLANIIRVGAQSVTIGLLKLIIGLEVYNKD